MYTQNYGNNATVRVAALGGDPNALDRMPGAELTEEQREISRKDREKLASLLQQIIVAQVIGIIGNFAVGAAGIMFYDSSEEIPYSVGSFICGGVLILSVFGGLNLRNSALNFVPEHKPTVCSYLMLFEIPNIFISLGCMMIIFISTTTNTFSDKCDDTSIFSFTLNCTSNPNADNYKTVAIVAIALVVYNAGLAIAAFAVLCTSPKAFVTNQLDFNRPRFQNTRYRGRQTMLVQQHLILQQQLAMQQQMHNQQMGMQPPPPMYGQSILPPPPPTYSQAVYPQSQGF